MANLPTSRGSGHHPSSSNDRSDNNNGLNALPVHPTTAGGGNGPTPSLMRRSSYEPMRLGLGSLPPPVFSRGPSGQRSVPAIEFVQPSGLTHLSEHSHGQGDSITSTTGGRMMDSAGGGGLPSVLASGANTPSGSTVVGLGNGTLTAEPWNLWSDSTVPPTTTSLATFGAGSTVIIPGSSSTSTSDDTTSTVVAIEPQLDAAASIGNTSISATSQDGNRRKRSASPHDIIVDLDPHAGTDADEIEDTELASALAAAVILDKNADKRSSIASRISAASAGGSPERLTAASSIDLTGLGSKATALLPRNVSFSSMLDLPQPDNGLMSSNNASSAAAEPRESTSLVGGLQRASSLNRRVASSSSITTPGMPSKASPLPHSGGSGGNVTTANNTMSDSLPLPSLGFSTGGSTYTSPATSYNSRQNNTSPVQNRHVSAGPLPTPQNPNIPPFKTEYYGSQTLDDYGTSDATSGGSAAMRNRQLTNNSSTFSDISSTTSMPFGASSSSFYTGGPPAFGGNHLHQQQQDGIPSAFNPGAFGIGNAGINSNFNPPRRDSGYGISTYNNSPPVGLGGNLGAPDRRGSRSSSWQAGPGYGYNNHGGIPPYSASPPPLPNPYASAFSLGPSDGGYLGFGSNSSVQSNTSSVLRYPSFGNLGNGGNNLDFLLSSPAPTVNNGPFGNNGGLQNYGLGGFMAPSSPYLGNALRFGGSGASNYGGPPSYLDGPIYERPRFEEKNRPIRSPLLEDFRADKLKRWSVRDMHGHIAEFMCDQVGSRYIQESILEHPTSEDCDLIFDEIHPLILQLSVDVFANFCVQKLLEKASTEQIAVLAINLKGSIMRLALQTYGCRVIQKALEVVSPEHQILILRELEGSVQKSVRDQNANHVIQKVVTTCPPDLLQFVVDAFIGNVYTFATHPYSCRVLQRILENCPERMTRPLLEELKAYAQNLMQDQYGNYVIQYCLDKGLPQDKSEIIAQIHGQVLHFSKHKFASNVIEKCIMNANERELNMLAVEVLAPGMDGNTGIQAMLRHEYANYPLQRLIKHTTGPLHMAIVEQVRIQLAMFREGDPPFNAKHLIAVEKLLVDLSPGGYSGLMRRFEDHYISRR